MADGPELGKAYVQVIPTAKGIKGKLEGLLGDEADAAGASGGKRFAAKFGAALGTVGKIAGAGIAAAATGISVIGKQAVSAYADFEQLSGGIETLFGEDAPAVMKSAENAFKSAGLSANDYMDTAIQSSASLIASLGGDTKKAASLMDLSITDMADNVNKMGTSMEAVQNAYRGFSRGNFTMLDNLALGFAGTKEGMQQLLDKAVEYEKAQGRVASFSIDSYSDIVQAIHIVQDNMGIAGTTAEEAAGTISGSISTMKAAWSNLLTGLADPNADQSALIANLAGSAKNVVKNLLPTIRTALKNAAVLVKELAPMIAEELPGLLQDVLPSLIDAALTLAIGLGTAFADNAPMIIGTLVNALIVNAPKLIEGAGQLVVALVSGLIASLPQILGAGLKIVDVLFMEVGKGFVKLVDAGKNLVSGLWSGINSAASWLWEKISGWLGGIWDGIKEFFGIASPSKEMAWAGEMLSEGLARGIETSGADAVNAAARMNADVMAAIGGDSLGLSASASSAVEIRHTGTIRVEGVNSAGELVGVMDLLYDQIVERLRKEVRYA